MKTLFRVFALSGWFFAWAGAPSTPTPPGQLAAVRAPCRTVVRSGFWPAGTSLASFEHCAQPSDYFPLEVGNLWIYRGGGSHAGTTLTLEIAKTAVFNGKTYFLLSGLPDKDYWLRTDDNGSVVAYDPSQAAEPVWWAFQAPPGKQYATYLPGVCCGLSEIGSLCLPYRGPVGNYDCALEILYPGVFQVGIESEIFLPNVGLALRRQATGGPSYGAWELTYARVDGATISAAPEFSFTLALDNSTYVMNMMPPMSPPTATPVANVRLTLRNTAQPVTLTFPTGQTFDFVIRNGNGNTVYRWSDDKAFPQVVENLVFGPGEKNYLIQVALNGPDKNPLPPGHYVAEGWLTTAGTRTFVASVGFDIQWLE